MTEGLEKLDQGEANIKAYLAKLQDRISYQVTELTIHESKEFVFRLRSRISIHWWKYFPANLRRLSLSPLRKTKLKGLLKKLCRDLTILKRSQILCVYIQVVKIVT